MNDFEQRKQDRIQNAIKTFKFCMEYDDPRLDQVVWVKTLRPTNPMAIVPHRYNEPVSVRKAILSTLFEFPMKLNVDTRIIDDDGIEYYESKSEFISPSNCTPEEQARIDDEKERLRKAIFDDMKDEMEPSTPGKVIINVNVLMNWEEPDFDNIVEWLNKYCAKNVDTIGRKSEYISVDVSKECLEKCGFSIDEVFWSKAPEITPKDIIETVQEREKTGGTVSPTTLRDKIAKYFENKRQERLGRRIAKQNEMMERARWDHRM